MRAQMTVAEIQTFIRTTSPRTSPRRVMPFMYPAQKPATQPFNTPVHTGQVSQMPMARWPSSEGDWLVDFLYHWVGPRLRLD